jgi:hypothetical protein
MGRQVLGLSMGLGSRDCLSSCIRANQAPRRLSSSTTTSLRTHLGKRMHSVYPILAWQLFALFFATLKNAIECDTVNVLALKYGMG